MYGDTSMGDFCKLNKTCSDNDIEFVASNLEKSKKNDSNKLTSNQTISQNKKPEGKKFWVEDRS